MPRTKRKIAVVASIINVFQAKVFISIQENGPKYLCGNLTYATNEENRDYIWGGTKDSIKIIQQNSAGSI